MNTLRVNATPIRTSEHFGMNDMVLKDVKIPELIPAFNNVTITKENAKVILDNDCQIPQLTYGNGASLLEQSAHQANEKIKIVFEEMQTGKASLYYTFDVNNTSLVDQIEIEAKAGSHGTVILNYVSADNQRNDYHNGLCKVYTQPGASVQVVIVNLLNDQATHFMSVESDVLEKANVELVNVDLGGQYSILNQYIRLSSRKAQARIDGVYLAKGQQVFDINNIIHLYGPATLANIEVQGALMEQAQKHFKGTLDFKAGCKKAKGNENEFCMLLSDQAKAKALPILLCTEEDVEGNHSTASGKVDKHQLFYLMSRGLSEKEAMKLMVKAKFIPIIDRIEDESLKQMIIKAIDERLA